MEDLGHDAAANAGETTIVELGFPQDVHPQRGIAHELVAQTRSQRGEVDTPVAHHDLVLGQRGDTGKRCHLLTAGELDHVAPGEVAEREIGLWRWNLGIGRPERAVR